MLVDWQRCIMCFSVHLCDSLACYDRPTYAPGVAGQTNLCAYRVMHVCLCTKINI